MIKFCQSKYQLVQIPLPHEYRLLFVADKVTCNVHVYVYAIMYDMVIDKEILECPFVYVVYVHYAA